MTRRLGGCGVEEGSSDRRRKMFEAIDNLDVAMEGSLQLSLPYIVSDPDV